MAETSIKQLEAEIEQLNRLVILDMAFSPFWLIFILWLKFLIHYFSGATERGRQQMHKDDAQVSGRQNSENGITT